MAVDEDTTSNIVRKRSLVCFVFALLLLIVDFSPTLAQINLDTTFPIIYEDPQIATSKRPTYFGYSVLLYASENYTWIQIGAPRSNDTRHPQINEPGLVYRCSWKGHCSSFVFDKRGNEKISSTYHDKKDGQWLGASMAIHYKAGLLAVCAPRWVDQIRKSENKKEMFIEGACYITMVNNNDYDAGDVDKMLPFARMDPSDEKYYFFEDKRWGNVPVFDYVMGQAGLSIHFTEDQNSDKPELLLGSPGVLNWKGSVVLLKNGKPIPNIVNKRHVQGTDTLSETIIPHLVNEVNLPFGAYFGYSVSSGYFFSNDGKKERLYVASAPRGKNLCGQVLIFKFPSKSRKDITSVKWLEGKEAGGGFGTALAVADLNNDGYDDLLVSSPLLKVPTVHIFCGDKKKSMLPPSVGIQQLQADPSFGENSRFGIVVTVNDLNLDGYKEILVGAPYAYDNRGAISIWRGGPNGPQGTGAPALILRASDFGSELRGFGMSISPPIDIDRNSYPDVAVGSFLSGHVVVLRGRPVGKLIISVGNYTVDRLLRTTTLINVPLCLEYLSHITSDTALNVFREISIDKEFKRASLKNHSEKNHIYKDKIVLNNSRCDNLEIQLKKGITNFFDPIEITVNTIIEDYETEMHRIVISKNNTTGEDGFNKFYPLPEVNSSSLKIPFETDCGDDNICSADLSIEISMQNHMKKFIIGSEKSIHLNITVKNKGEPAYIPQIILQLPLLTSLARLPTMCTLQPNSDIICDLENPLRTEFSLLIEVDMRNVLSELQEPLKFIAETITTSKELNEEDNKYIFDLTLAIEASIVIAGKSSKDEFVYQKTNETISRELVQFQHIYEVQKLGASPVEEVLITIKIPHTYLTKQRSVTFMKVYQPEGFHGGQSFSCENNKFLDMPDVVIEETRQDDELIDSDSLREKRHIHRNSHFISTFKYNDENFQTIDEKRRVKRSSIIDKNKFNTTMFPANRTILISCNQTEITCLEIKCFVGPYRRTQSVSRILLTMKVDISALKNSVTNSKDIVIINTYGTAKILGLANTLEVNERVFSVFISSFLPGEVALWLIILSVVLGLILLMIFTGCLVKMGFFQRKKKDELEALRKIENEHPPVDTDWFEEDLPEEDTNFEIDEKDLR